MARVKMWWDHGAEAKHLNKSKKALRSVGYTIKYNAVDEINNFGAVDTGRLRSSISVNWSGSGRLASFVVRPYLRKGRATRGKSAYEVDVMTGVPTPPTIPGKFTVRVGTGVYYAPFVEFGNMYMHPRPFLRNAFNKGIRTVSNEFRKQFSSKYISESSYSGYVRNVDI